jgi:hypothetical protein
MAPSTDKANPAPRDIQTEKVRVFRPASLGSSCCFFLSQLISSERSRSRYNAHHPKTKSPTWKPWKRKLNNNFVPRICDFK